MKLKNELLLKFCVNAWWYEKELSILGVKEGETKKPRWKFKYLRKDWPPEIIKELQDRAEKLPIKNTMLIIPGKHYYPKKKFKPVKTSKRNKNRVGKTPTFLLVKASKRLGY
jgi:hypothetical protein